MFARKCRRQSAARTRLGIEALEAREVPTVSVNADAPVRPVTDRLLGVNVACWDAYVSATRDYGGVTPDAGTVDLLRGAGLRFLRLSNGAGADFWHFNRRDDPFLAGP